MFLFLITMVHINITAIVKLRSFKFRTNLRYN
jgi:hypothetical protein